MHLILGEVRGNGAAAIRLYAEYLQRRLRTHTPLMPSIVASGISVLFTLLWYTKEDGEVIISILC
jgi:hypothetical protein